MRGPGDFYPVEETFSYDEAWADSHRRCERVGCRTVMCVADMPDGVGRENCPCDGDVPAAVVDGIDPDMGYCSDACRLLALVDVTQKWGCGAWFAGDAVSDGAAVVS